MKCLVLTGGAGNHMWPLSRKNYPKQFVYLDGGHSMFQETILRNMPYCDEFIIVSDLNYENIVKAQIKAFKSVRFKFVFEEEAKLTGPVIAFVSKFFSDNEKLLVVSTDNIIKGDYKSAIVNANNMVQLNRIVAFGVNKTEGCSGVGYFLNNEKGGVSFYTADDREKLQNDILNNDLLMDTGILMGNTGVIHSELYKYCPELMEKVDKIVEYFPCNANEMIISSEFVKDVTPISIADALTAKSDLVQLLYCSFDCERIRSFEALANVWDENQKGKIIKKSCDNSTIFNFTDDQLVIGNNLKDIIVVNTADAVYVSDKKTVDDIKRIITDDDLAIPRKLLVESPVYYTDWGYRENLHLQDNCWVRKVTIYPGYRLNRHKHSSRSENWTVISGTVTAYVGDNKYVLNNGESLFVERNISHQLINESFDNVILVETAVGEILSNDYSENTENNNLIHDNIIGLYPDYKEKIWGGTKLLQRYGKQSSGLNIAESWEISAHPNGQSVVSTGQYKGMGFGDYINMFGQSILGWKSQIYSKFPILVKFIDAREDLSVQVHPDDDYAINNEHQFGKNEMWYIVEAEEGACIYCGFDGEYSKEDIAQRILNNTLTDIMKSVPVKKGEAYFIPAGTVHAIGKGILICEIQQNSDVTYRLYDYGRIDKNGNTRELHIDKALDVLDPRENLQRPLEQNTDTDGEIICKCKYFTVEYFDCKDRTVIFNSIESFTAIVVISGSGQISIGDTCLEFKDGESYFAAAGVLPIVVDGNAEILTVRI